MAQFAPVALGLAYSQTGNVLIANELLLLANEHSKTYGALFAIQAIGFVLNQPGLSDVKRRSIFQLLQMCARSFDAQIRAGAAHVTGQIFASSGDAAAVEMLCKLMTD